MTFALHTEMCQCQDLSHQYYKPFPIFIMIIIIKPIFKSNIPRAEQLANALSNRAQLQPRLRLCSGQLESPVTRRLQHAEFHPGSESRPGVT